MSYRGVFQNILRFAIIDAVDYKNQTCTIRMIDRIENKTYQVPIPHGGLSVDCGFAIHPERNTLVLVGHSYREAPYIVATLPNASFAQDLTSESFTKNIPTEFSGYPDLNSGEVAMFGKRGSVLRLADDGTIQQHFGNSKHILDSQDRILSVSNENTIVTEAGFQFSGTILRDLRLQPSEDEKTENKLTDLYFGRNTSAMARDSNLSAVKITTALGSSQESLRNPALSEDRQITYEFARQFAADIPDREIDLQKEDQDRLFLDQTDNRANNRFDVLNLNVNNPNLLIERVKGTLVDIYGNVLDINRKVIDFPASPDKKDYNKRIPFLNALLRRSIKYHFEINVKKDMMGAVATDVLDGVEFKNGHTHSRWAIDVDNEGLTKINIPASSNIGNIPVLTRYVNNHLMNKTRSNNFKSDKKRDIFHLEFGDLTGHGIDLSSSYAPQSLNNGPVKYRTAFHDISSTANGILQKLAISSSVKNDIPLTTGGASGNAGGRSVHANLDGSLEINIGRDLVDGKSIVLDTSGGIVSRIGRTKNSANSASVISQVDGNIFIQVGGDHLDADDPIPDPEIHIMVKGSKGTDEVHIGSDFVKIKSAAGGKNIVLDSSKNIILKATESILITAPAVGFHGSAEDNGDNPFPQRSVRLIGAEI